MYSTATSDQVAIVKAYLMHTLNRDQSMLIHKMSFRKFISRKSSLTSNILQLSSVNCESQAVDNLVNFLLVERTPD